MSKKNKPATPPYSLSAIGKVGELMIRGTFLRECKKSFGVDENTALSIFRKALSSEAVVVDHYWGDDAVIVYRIAKHENIAL